MTAGLAPELRRHRRFGERQMAFARAGIARRQPLEPGHPRQRRLALADRAIDLRQLRVGCGLPGALDGLDGAAGALIRDQQARIMRHRRRQVRHQRLSLPASANARARSP